MILELDGRLIKGADSAGYKKILDNYKATVILENGLQLKGPRRAYTDDNFIRGPKI
ncbi:MAG: hypothetical protein IKP88_18540 [Lachnospiraceae bacterium]|nr:hypothetical protein [Lachnospiraceae bacterium]